MPTSATLVLGQELKVKDDALEAFCKGANNPDYQHPVLLNGNNTL
ncbi:hypothetical protein OO184_23260 [Photorhabdus sp. APURE]|nr:hypothetical protein [Photorhabdus aballayi]MCW7550768.1 hypothetical protein [Photorhabdus aballayi]